MRKVPEAVRGGLGVAWVWLGLKRGKGLKRGDVLKEDTPRVCATTPCCCQGGSLEGLGLGHGFHSHDVTSHQKGRKWCFCMGSDVLQHRSIEVWGVFARRKTMGCFGVSMFFLGGVFLSASRVMAA